MDPDSRDSLSLEALFVRFRDRGDATAFTKVFDRTAPALLAVARRLGRRKSDAEDLLQATFVTAIERASTFDPTRSLMAWLVGILAGHAKNAARRAARESGRAAPEIGRDPRLLDSLVDLEERAAVARAIDDLPRPYRETIALRLAKDGDAGPGATRPAGGSAFRMRVHRALARLRRVLPTSLLGLALAGFAERRVLASVRERVLEGILQGTIGSLAPATMTGALAGGSLTGLVMSKKLAAVVAAVLLAATAWIVIEERSADQGVAEDASQRPGPEVVANPPKPPATVDSAVERTTEEPDVLVAATLAQTGTDGVRLHGKIIDAETGRPVEGVSCFVSFGGQFDSVPTFVKPGAIARSDASGQFTMEGAEYERFDTLHVLAPTYAPLDQPIVRPSRDDAIRNGIDLGEIRLARGAMVRGRVVDMSGVAVPEVTLVLYDESPSFPCSYVASGRRMGRTNADGSFAIEHVRPTGGFPWRLFAISSRGCGATELDVLADPGSKIDVEIRLVAPARLDVEVVDAEGSPVSGAFVAAVPVAEPYVMNNWGWTDYQTMDPFPGRNLGIAWDETLPAEMRVMTSETGVVSFLGLPAKLPVTLAVAKKDHIPFFADVVKLDAGSTTRVRAVLAELRSFAIAGQVVDTLGKPMPDVTVERYDYYQYDLSPKRDEVVADGEGRFRFEDNAGGSLCHLCVGAPGIARRPLEVTLPADRGVLDLVLVALPSVPIAGVVVDAAGAPIPEASVAVEQEETYVFSDNVRTDSGGRFRVSNATAGSWRLTAVMPGDRKLWKNPQIEIDVAAGDETVRIVGERDLATGAEVSIEIVDAVSRQPLEPREAAYGPRQEGSTRLNGGESASDRRTGLVRFDRVKPGAWRARVKCDGHAAAYLDFDVSPTDTVVRTRIEVQAPARVRGRIVAPEIPAAELAAILKHAVVQGTPRGGLSMAPGEFEPARILLQGSTEFAFTQVPPGPISIQLFGELVGDVNLEAKPGEEHVIELHARRPGQVTTIGAADYPPGTLTIRLDSPGHADAWFFLGYVGSDIRDRTLPFQPGTWHFAVLYAKDDGSSRSNTSGLPMIAEGSIDVKAGETTELKLPPPK